MVWNYQNADGSLKKIICVIHYNFRHTFVPYTCSMDLLLCSSLFHQLYQEAAACFWAAEQKRWRMRITGITSVRQNPAQWRQLTSISSRTVYVRCRCGRIKTESHAGCSVLTAVQWIWLCVANYGNPVIVYTLAPLLISPAAVCLLMVVLA